MTIRYLEKFESANALTSHSFPLNLYEWETRQALSVPNSQVARAHYAYDHLGAGFAPRPVAIERVRYISKGTDAAIEAEIDNLRSKCHKIGRGKLYTIDSTSTRRWAWARLAAMPDVRVNSRFIVPIAAEFVRESDWQHVTQTTTTQTVTGTPTIWTVTNAGNAPVYAVAIRLRANTAAGFTNPQLENLTNGYSWSSTRDAASVNSELKVDAGIGSVEYSNDDGATYADDWSLFTRGSLQVNLFRLDPGANVLRYTDGGTPSLDISVIYYPAYY